MVQELITLFFVGLGIVHATPQGMVAGISDTATTTSSATSAAFTRELKEARERGLTASTSAHAAFRQKLSTIRDAKKKALAEKLNTNLNDVNKKRTEALMKYVDRVSEILAKVQTRAASAKASGKDTSSVDAAIAKAKGSIAKAKAAILAQAAKQYTASITSENTLRTDMGKLMSQLQADLKAVRDLVIAAHKDVSDAVKALALLLGESLPKTATESGAR